MNNFKLADSVLFRVVQILQEALVTETDIGDLLRQIELKPDSTDPHVLTLTEDYVKQVERWHQQLVDSIPKKEDSGESTSDEKKIFIA